MKYVVILGDGMADRAIAELGGKTPLEAAKKPNIDKLAARATVGMTQTLRDGMPLGSDVANLSVLGYEPSQCYSGRSPIEALGVGLHINDDDIVLRCNIVNIDLKEPFEESIMIDHSSDKITDEEAEELFKYLNEQLGTETLRFYSGASYRGITMWRGVKNDFDNTPPHDILRRCIKDYLPKGAYAKELTELTKKSAELLSKHPVNLDRVKRGLRPANCIWLWGEGTKPNIGSFREKYGKSGTIITAVPLLKGLGVGMGLDTPFIEGATGDIHTNYKGKADAAISAITERDFVFIHVEAPDECGHDGDTAGKVRSIELIDENIVGPVVNALESCGESYRILVMPDHATPICERTHTIDEIPFLMYDSKKETAGVECYCERLASETGVRIANGCDIMNEFFK